jgi:DNA-binding transcriptional ArsR family regulator
MGYHEHMNIYSDEFNALAELYKNFSDPTRLRIIYELSKEDLCVREIAERLDMSQSAISHQLRVLRNVRLVKFAKEGKMARYSLDDDHVRYILQIGADHVKHTK